MIKLPIVCYLALLQPLVAALDISVGETQLSIPPPSGFALVTAGMKPYSDIIASETHEPSQQQLAFLIPTQDATIAASGKIPTPVRWLSLATAKKTSAMLFTDADFASLKNQLKAANDKMMMDLDARIPDYIKNVKDGILDDHMFSLGLKEGLTLSFPIHLEEERAIAYSIARIADTITKDGQPSIGFSATTITFVYVQGKIIFLYVNSERSALEWNRTTSKHWADMIIAANLLKRVIATGETDEVSSGVDWSNQIGKAISIAAACAFFPLLGYLLRRRRRDKENASKVPEARPPERTDSTGVSDSQAFKVSTAVPVGNEVTNEDFYWVRLKDRDLGPIRSQELVKLFSEAKIGLNTQVAQASDNGRIYRTLGEEIPALKRVPPPPPR